MQKDYTAWHQIKTSVNNTGHRAYFHEKEVWFCNLGLNIGYEEDGKGKNLLRPVIILRKFNKLIFLAIPLTSQQKEGCFYHTFFLNPTTRDTALLSQVRILDSKRLKYKIGHVPLNDFLQIKQ